MNKVCPRCSSELSERVFGSVALDGCASCGGLWFDADELNRLTRDPSVGLIEVEQAFQRQNSTRGETGDMLCPNCAIILKEFSFPHTPNVVLDACPHCKGIWLDEGEMQAIAARCAGAHAKAAAPPSTAEIHRTAARCATGFLLSAPCPSCRTTNPAASLVCWACGKPLKVQQVMRLCPRCDRPLEELHSAAIAARVDTCKFCSGVWFEEGELSVFLRLGPEAINSVQQAIGARHNPKSLAFDADIRIARCPGCHYDMERRHFGGGASEVQIDVCSYCKSVWLDAGELSAAYLFMENGGFLGAGAQHADPWGRG